MLSPRPSGAHSLKPVPLGSSSPPPWHTRSPAAPIQVWSGNRAAVLADNTFPASTRAKYLYAGILRDRLAYPDSAKHVEPLRWVRSHQDESKVKADEARHVRGNALADAAAKGAVTKLHPSCDPLWCQQAEEEVDEAWAILQVIGGLAAEWQRPPQTAARKAGLACGGPCTADDRLAEWLRGRPPRQGATRRTCSGGGSKA